MFRKCLTIKEIEFLMAVSLYGGFSDGHLITLLAMPYFEIEELGMLFDLMQTWLTGYEDIEKLTDVKDYFKNHYEDTYNLAMTPLKTQHQ